MNLIIGSSFKYEADSFPGRAGFELTEAEIKTSGAYQEKLNYSISLDLSELIGDDPALKNAYIQYNFADPFRIRAGQSKIPFGQEYSLGVSDRVYISHSEGSKLIVPDRSVGTIISGKKIFNSFGYKIGIHNSSTYEEEENVSGHIVFSGNLFYNNKGIKTGYELLYSSDETFSHGAYLQLNLPLKEHINLFFLGEYLEQRYFNYHWNHSLYTAASLRVNGWEPVIYFDYYDDNVGYDGVEDKLIPGLGFNVYFLNDKLRLMCDLRTEYLYSQPNDYTHKLHNHSLTVKLVLEI